MKNIYKLAILSSFILLSLTAKSQDFKTGFSLGVNTSQISGDNLSGFRQFGFYLGGFAKYELDKDKSLQFEIIFTQKGSRKLADPEEGDFTFYNLRVNYAEVPLLYRFGVHENIVLEVGPYVSALLSFNEEDENGTFTDLREFNRVDVGALFGVSYYFTERLDVNVRFTNSLIPVRSHLSGSQFRLNRGQYHTAIAFCIQYQFNAR